MMASVGSPSTSCEDSSCSLGQSGVFQKLEVDVAKKRRKKGKKAGKEQHVTDFSQLTADIIIDTAERVLRDAALNPCGGSMQTGKLHDQVQKLLKGQNLDLWLKDATTTWNRFLRRYEGRLKIMIHTKEDVLLYNLSSSSDDPRAALADSSDEDIMQADILYSRLREKIQTSVMQLILELPHNSLTLDRIFVHCERQIPDFPSFVPSKNSLKDLVSQRYRVKFGDLFPRSASFQHQPYDLQHNSAVSLATSHDGHG